MKIETLTKLHSEDESLNGYWGQFGFDLDSVISWSKSYEGYTNVTFISGDSKLISIKYELFISLSESSKIIDNKALYEFLEQW